MTLPKSALTQVTCQELKSWISPRTSNTWIGMVMLEYDNSPERLGHFWQSMNKQRCIDQQQDLWY